MEKIVVIPKEHIEYEQISGAGFDTIRFHLGTDKTLEVPETFDELKELCKDNDKIGIGLEFIEYDNFTIVFKREGKILGCGDDLIIAENRTPQQMWNIIKSLIGEE